MKKFSTRDLTNLGLLIALYVVFSKFLSVQATPSIKISTTFIVIGVIGATYGPIVTGLVCALADIVGNFMFPPTAGAFFGFTISAFVDGVIFGYFLYKKPYKKWYPALVIILSTIIVSYGLNTYWLTILRDTEFMVELPLRVMKSFIIVPVNITVLTIVMGIYYKSLVNIIKRD